MSNGLYLSSTASHEAVVIRLNNHEERLRTVESRINWAIILLISNLAAAVMNLALR